MLGLFCSPSLLCTSYACILITLTLLTSTHTIVSCLEWWQTYPRLRLRLRLWLRLYLFFTDLVLGFGIRLALCHCRFVRKPRLLPLHEAKQPGETLPFVPFSLCLCHTLSFSLSHSLFPLPSRNCRRTIRETLVVQEWVRRKLASKFELGANRNIYSSGGSSYFRHIPPVIWVTSDLGIIQGENIFSFLLHPLRPVPYSPCKKYPSKQACQLIKEEKRPCWPILFSTFFQDGGGRFKLSWKKWLKNMFKTLEF